MKTPQPHPHAEVAIAWLNDQSINLEFRRRRPGAEWESAYGNINPITNPHFEWRIKPEPKPDVVRFGVALQYWGRAVAEHGDNLKVTYDGETGNLKSAEILK